MHDPGVKFNQSELANLENLRKSVASKILKLKIFCGVLGVVLAFLIFKSSGDLGIGICLGAMVGILIYRLLSYSLLKGFSNEFKEKIITQIIKEISPNLAYDKAKFIEFNEFDRPRIYNTVIDIYQGNDLIWGNIDGVELKFSDIYLARNDTKNKERSIQVQTPLFYGIVFIADFSKFFTAKVVVLDKKGSFTSTNLKKTKMDNSEFNDTFATFCDDEIAARYILSPS
ncbi:MAG: DUF3137 domain-containing protein, partial [Campylobacter sp.]|nr:DUF3137 domain-containing protein [Campylobacter sp.]